MKAIGLFVTYENQGKNRRGEQRNVKSLEVPCLASHGLFGPALQTVDYR